MDSKIITALIASTTAILGIVIKHQLTKKNKITKKILTLHNHSIFYYLDELEMIVKNKFVVSQSVCDWEAKEATFKDIMIHNIRIWRNNFEEMIKEHECTGNCQTCPTGIAQNRAMHMKRLNDGMDEFKKYYLSGDYTASEKKSIEICMNKFNEKQTSPVDIVSNVIESTHVVNEYFSDFCPIRSTGIILDMYKIGFHRMFRDIQDSIDTMNGDLKGLKFKKRSYYK